MSHDAIAGRAYGPFGFAAGRASVADFVAATGDDPVRWSGHAPPGFAAAALFAAAPAFLADPDVEPQTRSVVHAEQEFAWWRPLAIGESLSVTAEVSGVRSRGPLHVVTLTMAAGDERRWLDSTSTFLLSAGAAASAAEESEPGTDERGPSDPAVLHPLPREGAELPQMRRSASRADLVRYAAATRDWNPIHWDHAAARDAGLAGIVVHGLLMVSWLTQAAARHSPGPAPLQSMRVRFRAPLRPAAEAVVSGRVEAADAAGADLSLDLHAAGARLVNAMVRVTR
jgi:acyl dehydratase